MSSSLMSGKCSRCGKILKGNLKYKSEGKTFCFDCYQIEASRIMEEQSKQSKIFEYIKKIFQIKTLNDQILDGISKYIKNGMSEEDILYVLYYIYEINGLDLNEAFIISNIKRYFQEAMDYQAQQQKITNNNKNKEINAESVKIVIKKSDLDKESEPKFKYNMEDL